MFLFVSLSKSKFVTRVTLVSHSCRSCSTRVELVSHLCRSCLTCVALVSLVSHSCRIHVARVALVSLVCGARVVNQTRSFFQGLIQKITATTNKAKKIAFQTKGKSFFLHIPYILRGPIQKMDVLDKRLSCYIVVAIFLSPGVVLIIST